MSENTPITRRDMLAMPRADALRLGIDGNDEAANAQRLDAAKAIRAEQQHHDNAVYADARGTVDPDPTRPFGLDAIIDADGDLSTVVDRPDFTDLVLTDMGRNHREEYIHDEDGERWETISPSRAETAEAAYQATLIRAELANRGILTTRPFSATAVEDALVSHRLDHVGSSAILPYLDSKSQIDGDIADHIRDREQLTSLFEQHRGDDLAHALQERGFLPASPDIDDPFTSNFPVLHSWDGRALRHPNEVADALTQERVDNAVKAIAEHLPYAETFADMGAVQERNGWTLSLTFGSREPDVEPDQADIDPNDAGATWLFSSDEHTNIVDSGLPLNTDPRTVANWITDQAAAAGSPAYINWAAQEHRSANGFTTTPRLSGAEANAASRPAHYPSRTNNRTNDSIIEF